MSKDTKSITGRRSLQFQTLDEILRDAEQFTSGEVEAIGNWTTGQIVDHVRRIITASRAGFKITLPLPVRIMARLVKNRVLNGAMSPGYKIPKSATDELIPERGVTVEDAVQRLRDEVALSREPGVMTQPSPFFGSMTHEDWVRLHCRHAEMHFSFVLIKTDD